MWFRTPQEHAFDLLVHLWANALVECYPIPEPFDRLRATDVIWVGVITLAGALGATPELVLAAAYERVYTRRRLSSSRRRSHLNGEEIVLLRSLARAWVSLVRERVTWVEEGRICKEFLSAR